jgi:hypothetical protein
VLPHLVEHGGTRSFHIRHKRTLIPCRPCSYQEDAYAYAALSLNPEELRASAKNALGVDWDPASAGGVAGQALFVGVYDG